MGRDRESTDLRAIMDRDARRRRMLNDPDLTGDVLLFALALDELLATRKEQGRRSLKNWVAEVAELAHGTGEYYRPYWGKKVIREDFPRYEVAALEPGQPRCVAPMVRRDGVCGRAPQVWFVDHDPETGEGRNVGLCRRHRPGLEGYYQRRREEWRRNGKPVPPANTGGVLRRYFTADWDAIYGWARPGVEPMEGGREATPPRPRLRLIPGGEQTADQEVH
ncbi:hypothetical protein [Nocardia otitidiscaviarum]|uniref:hypothetical protein n=1 Tax=Nocardia otitidiscaviarum TaxID=1823 RepID=UPI0004A7449F|nr:hypothetical protein [Nocardia otitidiscaviarum]